jgi:hypothetical protein
VVIFWKRSLPVLITFVLGVTFALQYYVPHPASEALLSEVSVWNQIIAGFAAILGVASLLHVHYVKMRRRGAGWGYSVVLYLSMVVTLIVGFWSGGESENSAFGWLYSYILVALSSTMFSILAFFVASAAYRAFRARSLEATVLLTAAVFVMFGRVPLGEYLVSGVGLVSDWIMNVPNTAARRGIMIGISLGGIATSIKIIFGIERAYLGGGGE